MKRIGLWCVLGLFFVVTLLISGFTLAAEQKGEVVIATYFPNFYQKGGDIATHMSGYPTPNQHVFDSLIWADSEQNMMPGLAKSWKITKSWTDMEFFLRDDVKFHNGDPFTAEDVKFSIYTYLRPELKYLFRPLWVRNIKSVDILGPYHVRIVLNQPDPGFIGRLWWGGGVMPKKYREKVGDDGFADKPIGTGPFKWLDYKQDVYWRAEAVKKHFRHTPEYKYLKVMYVPEHSTRLAMLKAGEADIVDAIGPHVPQIKADPKLRIIWGLYPYLQTIAFADVMFPEEKSPFLDIKVRKAASLAIDRKAICEKILFGAAEPYGEIISPITWGYDPTIKPESYDPEQAKKLLAEAGYPDGFSTTINSTAVQRYYFEAIASNLADVGIKAEMKIWEGATFSEAYRNKKLRGLASRTLWWHCEKHAAADLSDMFLKWMPGAIVTNDEIHNSILSGMKAQSEEDMIAVGKKLSKMVRESQLVLNAWVNHQPYGVSPKIAYWEPQLGAIPATAWELIRLKK